MIYGTRPSRLGRLLDVGDATGGGQATDLVRLRGGSEAFRPDP